MALRPGLGAGAALALASVLFSLPALAGDPEVDVRLLADVESVGGEDRFDLAVVIDIEEGWYIHWENPGDSGMATTARLTGPDGYRLGRVRFPGPERFQDPETRFITYGYTGSTALFVEVEAPDEVTGPAAFSADVRWLACKEGCVFQSARVVFALPVRRGPVRPAEAELLAPHRARLPLRLRANPSRVDTEQGYGLTLVLPGPGPVRLLPTLPLEDYLIGFEARSDGSSARLELRRPSRAPIVVRPVFEMGDGSFVTLDVEVEPRQPPVSKEPSPAP